METKEAKGIAIITGGTSGIALGAAKELIGNGDIQALILCYLSDLEGALAAKTELIPMMKPESDIVLIQGTYYEIDFKKLGYIIHRELKLVL